jgi:hypothetical protein
MIPRTIPGRTNNNFSLSGLVQELLYKFSCIQVCQENSITKENNDFKQKIHNLDRHDLESKRSISLIYIEFKDQNNFQLRIHVCSIKPLYDYLYYILLKWLIEQSFHPYYKKKEMITKKSFIS